MDYIYKLLQDYRWLHLMDYIYKAVQTTLM